VKEVHCYFRNTERVEVEGDPFNSVLLPSHMYLYPFYLV